MTPEQYNKLTPDQQAIFDELAGIYEHCAGLEPGAAERQAIEDIRLYFPNHLTEKKR